MNLDRVRAFVGAGAGGGGGNVRVGTGDIHTSKNGTAVQRRYGALETGEGIVEGVDGALLGLAVGYLFIQPIQRNAFRFHRGINDRGPIDVREYAAK